MITNSSTEALLEEELKDLLQEMLINLEQQIESQEELMNIQNNLKDYETLIELVQTIKFIFTTIMSKKEVHPRYFKSEPKQQNYLKLESVIQKYEKEIRVHIRTEHELKLYAEQLQQQLEDSETVRNEYLDETTKIIKKLKKENYELSQQLKKPSQNSSKRASQVCLQQLIQQQQQATQKQTQIPSNSLQQLNYLYKATAKDSQKSLTGRPLIKNRNKSYSVGVSKQSSMNSSFNKELVPKAINKKSFHTDNRYRYSIDKLKQLPQQRK